MSGHAREVPYFEDRVQIAGFKVCNNAEQEIRENAASLMLHIENSKEIQTNLLRCLYDTLVFSPPIYMGNNLERQTIPYKEIVGFYLAPTYRNRLVLVVHESQSRKVYLYGIQMSSAEKTREISSILGDARTPSKASTTKQDRAKTVIVKPIAPDSRSRRKPSNHDIRPTRTMEVSNAKVPQQATKSEVKWKEEKSPSYNGYTNGYSNDKVKLPSRYTEIISSGIENDWSDIRGISYLDNMDDMDERISIGYYNDEKETMDNERSFGIRDEDASERTISPQNAWVENITYISNHPENGGQMSGNGSIYMYVAQQVNSRNENRIML